MCPRVRLSTNTVTEARIGASKPRIDAQRKNSRSKISDFVPFRYDKYNPRVSNGYLHLLCGN